MVGSVGVSSFSQLDDVFYNEQELFGLVPWDLRKVPVNLGSLDDDDKREVRHALLFCQGHIRNELSMLFRITV
jgi:hypothetical protein